MDNNTFDSYPGSLIRVTKKGDIIAAFFYDNLEEGENVFVEMRLGFQKKCKVLMLKKTLYGLCKAPHAFCKYIVEKLEAYGMSQSKLDPCLFIGEKVICICYVCDLLFWSKNEACINEFAMLIHHSGVDLEQKDDATGFSGVHIEHNESCLPEMKQEGLIDHVINALGLNVSTVNRKATTAEAKPLVKDTDGEVAHGVFSYSSLMGMLLYLSGHLQSDIANAVNCAAHYIFCPRHSHELA